MGHVTHRNLDRLLTDLERQGAVLVPKKKGVMVRLPNGQSVMFHKSPSDHRADKNLRALVKSAGLEWPLD